nr:MAG TPA: hypothetical protein [Bacteriophage sp.]
MQTVERRSLIFIGYSCFHATKLKRQSRHMSVQSTYDERLYAKL